MSSAPSRPGPGAPRTPRPGVVVGVRLAYAGLVGLTGWLGHRSDAVPTLSPLRFREVSEQVGIAFRHEAARFHPSLEHVAPQVSSLGAGVSVVDVDGDGDLDVFTVSSAHGTANALYLNDGAGGFSDVAPRCGLADLNRDGEGCSQAGLFADYDEDGDQDLFLVRWGRSLLLRNEGDLRFTDVTAAAGLERWMNASTAVWFDADRDGDLDLFVGGYHDERTDLWDPADTRVLHESFEFAHNGGRNALYRNRGDGSFEDVSDSSGLTGTRWTLAAAAVDLDHDGWQDLYLANDFGPEELFLNRGADGADGLRFEPLLGAGLDEQSKSGMCVAVGTIDNDDPRWSLFVTNITEPGYVVQGNNLRVDYLNETGRFLDLAQGQLQDCGWAWGAQFGDLDLDGRQDLFVTNGFYSGDPDRDYWYDMAKIGGALGSLVEDAANWPPFDGRSLSGYQRSRVLLNRGRHFRDVADVVGVTDTFDGRSVALADLFGDGTLDAVVANQRGPLLVYRSDPISEHHWIAFDLEGTTSNRDAIGAVVSVDWEGGTQRQLVSAGMGLASQLPRRLHFGLGGHAAVERVHVLWPSGIEQQVEGPAVDRIHTLTEPAE